MLQIQVPTPIGAGIFYKLTVATDRFNAIRYHLAIAQLRSGTTAEARSNLERALKTGQSFEGIQDARTMLAALQTR